MASVTGKSSELIRKLNPARFPGMSGKMAAIVGYVLCEPFTNPGITELVVTSDGFVLAQVAGDVGCNDIIGNLLDLERNWYALLDTAELNLDERVHAERLFSERIVRH